MKKSVIAIVMTALMMISIMVPLLSVEAFTSTANGVTVDGLLKSDTYVLYPFTKENLYLGISKYGELINGEASPKVGLKYGTLDVFANPNVAESDWSQGWYIDIHYADNDNNYQNIWAFAMYSDLSGSTGIGGDWKEACVNGPLGTPHGGRKTNAWATTDPIKVLYDGPRRFVVQTNTTLFSAATKTPDDALVGVVLTFEFDKVKKCVVVFKDIKRLNPGKWTRTFQVEFSNRGEWDIGTSPAPPSYGHFYDDRVTSYSGYDWHDFYMYKDVNSQPITGFDLAQMISKDGAYVGFAAFWPQTFGKLIDGTTHITRTEVLNSLCTKMFNRTWLSLGAPANRQINFAAQTWPSADAYPRGAGDWSDEPMVFINGILVSGGGADYTWDGTTDTITFTMAPENTDYITVVYKHQVPTGGGSDDMANHVPEPQVPYVIGEWCFDLKSADKCRQFRAVTVYGLTNRHTADDDNVLPEDAWSPPGANNIIDNEVQYYLDETFNPWDLYDAVEKDTRRWVQFYTVTTSDYADAVDFGIPLYIDLQQKPVLRASVWEAYDSNSEKVLWGGALKVPQRAWPMGYNYELNYYSDGSGEIYIPATQVPTPGTVIKILYSTFTSWSVSSFTLDTWEFTNQPLDDTGVPITLINAADVDESLTDALGAEYEFEVTDFSVTLLNNTMRDATQDLYQYITNYFADFKVFKGTTASFDCLQFPWSRSAGADLFISASINDWWTRVTAPDTQDIHVDLLWPYLHVDVAAVTNGTHYNATATLWVDGNIYNEHIGGRYEWGVVGRDAASVDSAGLSMVSAAFKNKQVEYGLAGADMFTPLDASGNAVNQMPWVMSKITAEDLKANYYYSGTDYRTALRDDWCYLGTTRGDEVPVASSNMIGVGGPLANMLAYYGNDFTDAFYGLPKIGTQLFADTPKGPYLDKVAGVSCWNRGWNGTYNTYSSSNTIGYAVISTYQDINGTVLFLIYGHWGRDTYYATKWFHEVEIYELQDAYQRRGLTSMIVQIRYENTTEGYKPTRFTIVECLGTISETLWKYGSINKGGIHDP